MTWQQRKGTRGEGMRKGGGGKERVKWERVERKRRGRGIGSRE